MIALLTLAAWAVLIAAACALVAWLVEWRRRVQRQRAIEARLWHARPWWH